MSHTKVRTRGELLAAFGEPNYALEIALDTRDAQFPAQAPDTVYAVVGTAVTTIHPPAGSLVIGVLVENGSFRVRAGDQVQRTVASVDTTANTLTITSHGYHDGEDGPVLIESSTSLPAPLVSGTLYYPREVDTDTITLHTSRAGAEHNTGAIDLTSEGAGTITLGVFPDEAAATDQAIGNNSFTMSAGTGQGNSPITPYFQAFRAATSLTVSGSAADARLKYFTA